MHQAANRNRETMIWKMHNEIPKWIHVGICLISITGVPALGSTFDALCPSQKCKVVLDRTGINIGKDNIKLQHIHFWDSESNDASPSSASGKARGAVLGGLAGAALLGPVGAAIGAMWASSEESGGQVQSDQVFVIEGTDDEGEVKNHKIRFLSQTAARRFRMELPMFTGLRAGRRSYTTQITESAQNQKKKECWTSFKKENPEKAEWIESNPTLSKKQRTTFDDC